MLPPPPAQLAKPRPTADASSARLLTEAVTRLRRALRVAIRTECPWETLPMAQLELLQDLAERSPARIRDLAARKRLAASTVSGLIGLLINSGLVARAVDPTDRRACAITLTEAGKAQLDGWTQGQERCLNRALAALDEADRAAIHAVLPALFKLSGHLDDEQLRTP